MIDLKEYRIIRLDKWNIVAQKLVNGKWTRVTGYHLNLDNCIKDFKNYLINEELSKDTNMLQFLNDLNDSYVNCNINVNMVED